MSRRLILIATIIVLAVASHVAFVLAVPYGLTRIAAERISRNGTEVNRWIYPPPADETSREIVRPSPDLAYAACVFDLRDGPVRITVTPGDSYTSLTLYAPNTDATVINADRPVDILIARAGQSLPNGPWTVIRTSDRWGIALQRRLAPTDALFQSADRLRRQDRCEPVHAPKAPWHPTASNHERQS